VRRFRTVSQKVPGELLLGLYFFERVADFAKMGLCEISSLILTGISVTEIKNNPSAAWGLGIASAVSNGASLALTYAAFKIEDKIRKPDRAARRRRAETGV
jgi:hypothetical protein